jgi:hypothetical protein
MSIRARARRATGLSGPATPPPAAPVGVADVDADGNLSQGNVRRAELGRGAGLFRAQPARQQACLRQMTERDRRIAGYAGDHGTQHRQAAIEREHTARCWLR